MGELWNGLLSGLGAMLSFFYDLIPSYGIAIILLTVAVRILLLPLGIKQTRSMQAMQKLQPQVKELQRKYKGNRQKMTEELQKLYKEHQVNPLAGCLPLLLQLPVFFALYQVLTRGGGTQYLPDGTLKAAISAGGESFLGINLACPPSRAGSGLVALIEGAAPTGCGGAGARVLPYLLIGLMAFTTWFQQRQMTRASAATGQNQQMQLMGRIMPIFLAFISWNIATGVLLYWVTTNAWQIGQQTFMLRSRAREARPQAPLGDGSPPKNESPPVKKPGEAKGGKSSKGGKGGQRGRKKRSKR